MRALLLTAALVLTLGGCGKSPETAYIAACDQRYAELRSLESLVAQQAQTDTIKEAIARDDALVASMPANPLTHQTIFMPDLGLAAIDLQGAAEALDRSRTPPVVEAVRDFDMRNCRDFLAKAAQVLDEYQRWQRTR